MTITKYIKDNFKNTIRNTPSDEGNLLGLPFEYTVPSISNDFQELYYWDTYFTNLGLICCDMLDVAKHNIENMLYLVNKLGYMPNGNHKGLINRSQPPFLSLMVRSIFDAEGDTNWLSFCMEGLKKEYKFWMSCRCFNISKESLQKNSDILDSLPAKTNLNYYFGNHISKDMLNKMAELYKNRTGIKEYYANNENLGRHCMAVCESGWDMTDRWGVECHNTASICLNSLLYAFEDNMAFFSDALQNGEGDLWRERRNERATTLRCLAKRDDIFYDYNLRTEKLSDRFTCASFYPLFCGMATKNEAEAIRNKLNEVEQEFGVCVDNQKESTGCYQWSYPNSWAPLNYIVVKGLLNYGYRKDAIRIAKKYISSIEYIYSQTGNLWEKYNSLDGTINVVDEYKMPSMMGWTAGVYLQFKKLTNKN